MQSKIILDSEKVLNFDKRIKKSIKRDTLISPSAYQKAKNRGASKSKSKKLGKSIDSSNNKMASFTTIDASADLFKKNVQIEIDEKKTILSLEATPHRYEEFNFSESQSLGNLKHDLKEPMTFKRQKIEKKDRKYSEKMHAAIKNYQKLKNYHEKESELFGHVLSQKEMHRLKKIYTVEDAQYFIQIIDLKAKCENL